MAEVTIDDLKNNFYANQVKDSALEAALAKSIAEVKIRIGLSAYSDMTADNPSDAVAAVFVGEAVENFTMARLARNLNFRFRPSGLVAQEQDAGSPSTNASSQVLNKYLTPQDQMALSKQFRDEAEQNLDLAGFATKTSYTMTNVSDIEVDTSIPRQTSSEAFDVAAD